jgi:hypothetical protein
MPYKSKKQEAFFHTDTAKKAGITGKEVKEWDKASKGKDLPNKAKVPPEKKKGYHGHEGSSHEHMAKQDRRGANKAAATRTVKIQKDHECVYSESASPEKLSPKKDKYMAMKRKDDNHDPKMKKRK